MGWRGFTHSQAFYVNGAIPPLLVAHGFYLRGWPWIHLLLHTWGVLIGAIILCCGSMQALGCVFGARLQPDKAHAFVDTTDAKARKLLFQEFLETCRCMFCISCMAAFPLLSYHNAEPTGLVWTVKETGKDVPGYLAGFLVGIPAADLWLYTKHRCAPLLLSLSRCDSSDHSTPARATPARNLSNSFERAVRCMCVRVCVRAGVRVQTAAHQVPLGLPRPPPRLPQPDLLWWLRCRPARVAVDLLPHTALEPRAALDPGLRAVYRALLRAEHLSALRLQFRLG
jgi:hypothetical protein